MEARRIESQHESRLDAIQAQHQALRAKEKTIAEVHYSTLGILTVLFNITKLCTSQFAE